MSNNPQIGHIDDGSVGSSAHVEFTDGRVCNCNACVSKRGYILALDPHKTVVPILFKKQTGNTCDGPADIYRARTESLE